MSAITAVFVIPNCWASLSDAGAIMEEETGEMKVKAETIAVAAHLRLNVQLSAREGLAWISHG